MSKTISQQASHYLSVLKWMVSGYYKKESKSFWLIQILMGASVGLSLVWLLGLIAGLNQLSNSEYLTQFELPFLIDFFSLPLWVWLSVLSLAGLLGAACMFGSFHLGVQSIIRYQVHLLHGLLRVINKTDDVRWLAEVEDDPRKKTHKILKMSVQLCGLVIRRLARLLIPLVTFIMALVALIKINGGLLVNLVPLSIFYIVVLYFINRHAARNQVRLNGVSDKANSQLGFIIDNLLFQQIRYDKQVVKDINQSDYRLFSKLRYRRRLAEIHVLWVNTLFLVLGSALIVLDFGIDATNHSVDWMNLILFLVALRYASNGLQQIASSTVAFSRFLPESEMVYHLFNPVDKTGVFKSSGLVYYFDDRNMIDGLLPQLLDFKFGAKHSVLLSNENAFELIKNVTPNGPTWVFSTRPALFKNEVKKNQTHIDQVIIRTNSEYKIYDDLVLFLKEFDPKSLRNYKNNIDVDYVDEMF